MKTYSIHDQAAMDMLQERRDYSEHPDYWDDPEPDPLDEQAFLDSLQGLTTDEIRKANRRRNAAIKNKQKEQKK